MARKTNMTSAELDGIMRHLEAWLRRAAHENIEGFGGINVIRDYAEALDAVARLIPCDADETSADVLRRQKVPREKAA